jgi:hypothetical protein
MSKITVVFVGGDSGVDKVIDTVTNGNISHVAIKILGGTLEALGIKDSVDKYPGVWLHDTAKYDNNPYADYIDIDLPDLASAEKKAKLLLGKFYSYIGCIEGGAYDLFGVQLHPWLTKVINVLTIKALGLPVNIDTGEWTMNCSETVTRILRAGGLNILPGVDADCITPEDLRVALNGVELSKINNFKESDNMSEENVSQTTTEAITTVATAAESVLDQEKDELIAKLKMEIASTKSTWVKFRDTMYIAALEEADDLVLEALVNKLAKL